MGLGLGVGVGVGVGVGLGSDSGEGDNEVGRKVRRGLCCRAEDVGCCWWVVGIISHLL